MPDYFDVQHTAPVDEFALLSSLRSALSDTSIGLSPRPGSVRVKKATVWTSQQRATVTNLVRSAPGPSTAAVAAKALEAGDAVLVEAVVEVLLVYINEARQLLLLPPVTPQQARAAVNAKLNERRANQAGAGPGRATGRPTTALY